MKQKIYCLFTMLLLFLFCNICFASDYDSHWAKDDIDLIVDANVLSLSGDNFFPDEEIIASQVDIILNNYVTHSDTDEDNKTKSSGEFNSFVYEKNEDDCITREELAIIVSRFLEIDVNIDAKTTFLDDEEIHSYSRGYVAKLQEKNILVGYPDFTYKPKRNVTKAELVTVANRIKNEVGQEVTILKDEDVLGIEIGFLNNEEDGSLFSLITDQLVLKSGDMLYLAIVLPDEYEDEDVFFEIENPDVVQIDDETLLLEALQVGETDIKFYSENIEPETIIKVIVE